MSKTTTAKDDTRRELLEHPVSELTLRPAVTVLWNGQVRDAIRAMRKAQLGCVFVINQEGQPLGKFTEFMLVKLLLNEPGAVDDPILKHMAVRWAAVRLDDPISHVVRAMQRDCERFVCVLDNDGAIAALTGQKGVMEYIAERFSEVVRSQHVASHVDVEQREGA